ELIYNSDVYAGDMIERLMVHFKRLLGSILSDPGEQVSRVDYLSDDERHELLHTFNDRQVNYPKDRTLADLYTEQMSKLTANIGVVFENTELTYEELNEVSNQLAHYLRDNYDIQTDDLVGIQLERSEWMLVSILGVLKSG